MTEETMLNIKVDDLIDTAHISARIKADLNDRVADSVKWNMSHIVEKHCKDILDEEIKKIVEAQKDTILKGVVDSLPLVAKAISEAMAQQAAKNLTGYNAQTIISSIFK